MQLPRAELFFGLEKSSEMNYNPILRGADQLRRSFFEAYGKQTQSQAQLRQLSTANSVVNKVKLAFASLAPVAA